MNEPASRPDQPIHATCVAMTRGVLGWLGLGYAGVLLLGPSGSGKSDLALRLLQRGARMVADDRVILSTRFGCLTASPPEKLRGMIEVRGVGVLPCRWQARTTLHLAAKLTPGAKVERLPDPLDQFEFDATRIPMIEIDPFHASAPAKVETALMAARRLARHREDPLPAAQGAPS